MAEELGLDQVGRHRTTIEDDDGALAARRELVNALRYDFFARASLALDDDGGRRWSNLLDNRVELPHLGVAADDVATTVEPAAKFWPAEDYHQEYYKYNGEQPYCRVVIDPKVAKFRQRFASRLKSRATR